MCHSDTCHIPAKYPTRPLAGCFSFLPASHLRFKIVFRMAKRALFLFQLPPALSVQIHTARTDARHRRFKHTAQTSDHTQRSVHWAEPVPLCTPLQQTLCEFISVLCRASQQLLRFRPIFGNAISPDVQLSQLVFCPGRRESAHRYVRRLRRFGKKPCRGSCVRSTAFPVQKTFRKPVFGKSVPMLRSTFKPVRGFRFVEERRRLIRVQLTLSKLLQQRFKKPESSFMRCIKSSISSGVALMDSPSP